MHVATLLHTLHTQPQPTDLKYLHIRHIKSMYMKTLSILTFSPCSLLELG